MKENFSFIIPIGDKLDSMIEYKLYVNFYETKKEMYDELHKAKNKSELRIFYPSAYFTPVLFAKASYRNIGTISFSKEKFDIECIIHKSFHCMLEVYRKISPDFLSDYEERIVTGCARLAGFLFEQFENKITKTI
jgi:hypothetical protein